LLRLPVRRGQQPAEPGPRHWRHGDVRQGRRPLRTDRLLPEPFPQQGLGGGAEVADRGGREPEHRSQRVELLDAGNREVTRLAARVVLPRDQFSCPREGGNMSRTVVDGAADTRLSLSRHIYSTVRERIILGQYPQGSRLPEQRIGEELDVSRVPVREAVPLLERAGFVHSYPRRGAVVASWDAKAIGDLFDARLSLEVGTARYAARQVACGGSMDGLNHALDEAQRMVAAGD